MTTAAASLLPWRQRRPSTPMNAGSSSSSTTPISGHGDLGSPALVAQMLLLLLLQVDVVSCIPSFYPAEAHTDYVEFFELPAIKVREE